MGFNLSPTLGHRAAVDLAERCPLEGAPFGAISTRSSHHHRCCYSVFKVVEYRVLEIITVFVWIFCCSCSPGRTRKLIFPPQPRKLASSFRNLSQVGIQGGGGVEIKNGKHLKVDCIVLCSIKLFFVLSRFYSGQARSISAQFSIRIFSGQREGVYPWCNRVSGGGGTAKSISLLSEF